MKQVDVLLIHPPYHHRAGSGIIPPIGLAYVAAFLERENLSVSIIDCALDCHSQSQEGLEQFRVFLHKVLPEFSPSVIGIGPTTTPALKSLYTLANVLRDFYPTIPLIYGGPFASMKDQLPIFFNLLGAAAIVRGEGEEVFPKLVRSIREHKREEIPGVAWSENDKPNYVITSDINQLPYPARHLLDNQRYKPSLRRNVFETPITAIYMSRGCPYRCNFCVSPLLRGNRIDRRTNDNLFGEMRECIDKFGIKGFIFYDDCLFLKSNRLNQKVQHFCKGLNLKVGAIKWEMEMRCDAVASLSERSMQELYISGCRQINMGIEKASDQQLNQLNKGLTTAEIFNACNNVKKYSPQIRLAGTFILGGPSETEAHIESQIRFAKELPLDFAHFYPLEIYPGTPFFAAQNQGQSPTEWAYKIIKDEENYWGEMVYETQDLPGKRLLELAQQAYQEFYNRPEWINQFSKTVSADFRDSSLEIVKQWCIDRFQLLPRSENPFT